MQRDGYVNYATRTFLCIFIRQFKLKAKIMIYTGSIITMYSVAYYMYIKLDPSLVVPVIRNTTRVSHIKTVQFSVFKSCTLI